MLLLVVSETGLVYTFTTPKLQPLVTKPEGKNLIQVRFHPHRSRTASSAIAVRRVFFCHVADPLQACLNAPEPSSGDANGVDDNNPVDSPEDNHAQVPAGQPRGMPGGAGIPPQYMTPEAALHYQSYLQQQQQASNQYPGMPQQGMPRHPGGHYPQDNKLS